MKPMARRKYTYIRTHEAEIIAMRREGMTRQQIADALGLDRSQIKNWVTRHNRKRNPFVQPPFNAYEQEILLLKNENERLRNTLNANQKT